MKIIPSALCVIMHTHTHGADHKNGIMSGYIFHHS